MKRNQFIFRKDDDMFNLTDPDVKFDEESGEFIKVEQDPQSSEGGGTNQNDPPKDPIIPDESKYSSEGDLLDDSGQVLLTKDQIEKGYKYEEGKVIEPENDEESNPEKKDDPENKNEFITVDNLTVNDDGDGVDENGEIILTKDEIKEGYKIGKDGDLYDKDGKKVEAAEESIFKVENPIEKNDKGEVLKIDWKTLAQKRGFEVEEETPEAFMDAVDNYIDSQKEVVQLDLEKYEPNTRAMIEYFENGGKPEDILTMNDRLNKLLSMSDEDKVKRLLVTRDKMEESEADMEVEMMKNDGRFEKQVTAIDNFLSEQRKANTDNFINQFNDKNKSVSEKRKADSEKSKREVILELNKVEEFHGLKISKEDKNNIELLIKNGTFEKMINNPAAKLKAFMESQFGTKARLLQEKKLRDEKRKSFSEGRFKELKDNHNPSKDQGTSRTTGQPSKGGVDGLLSEMDD